MGERMTFMIAFTKLAIFKLLVAIFNLCRNVIWLCNGTASRLAKNEQEYKTSAHKLHIWYKYYVDSNYPLSMTNFILFTISPGLDQRWSQASLPIRAGR